MPIREELYRTIELMEQLGHAKAALARLHGRSAVIPNQGLLINSISLQEAKSSSEIENIFTTDDELYKAYSDQKAETSGASKEVLRYREALWSGYYYLQESDSFDLDYFIRVFQEIKQTSEGIRPEFLNTTIKLGGSYVNAGQVIYTPPRGATVIQNKLKNLIEFLFTQPFTKVKHLVDSKIYAENTAREYLNSLCEMQVLEKKEIAGHHYYLNQELYRILSD